MTEARFEVEVTQADADAFARLSGDWNPLHTDAGHAAHTGFARPVLHGAFSAGLFSRLAGMHLPGRDCVLHSLRLRFVAPIRPPASLVVSGCLAGDTCDLGRVDATVVDARTGARYVEGSYEFSRHGATNESAGRTVGSATIGADAPVLVTGATGGIGRALVARLGEKAVGVSRAPGDGLLAAPRVEDIAAAIDGRRIGGIVHCAWPMPDNQRLLALADPSVSVEHHLARPVGDMIALAKLLAAHGRPDAILVLVGSTFAEPGRHAFRMPLYTVAKSTLPLLARILAVELAAADCRVAAVVFDVLEGGMNKTLSRAMRQAHADRVPAGRLATMDEAAEQIAWLLDNRSHLVSGATLTLSGGALP